MKMYFIKDEFFGETLTTSKEFFEEMLINILNESFELDTFDVEEYDNALKNEFDSILERIYGNREIVEVYGTKFAIAYKKLILEVLKEEK